MDIAYISKTTFSCRLKNSSFIADPMTVTCYPALQHGNQFELVYLLTGFMVLSIRVSPLPVSNSEATSIEIKRNNNPCLWRAAILNSNEANYCLLLYDDTEIGADTFSDFIKYNCTNSD